MSNNHYTHPEFERDIQLQMLELERNNRRSAHDWKTPLNITLVNGSEAIKFDDDRLGFAYYGPASKFRVALAVRFAYRLRAAPVSLNLEFREWSPENFTRRLHKDRLGFDHTFGPGRVTGSRSKAIPGAVLTARFADRLRASPCKAHLIANIPLL